MQLDRLLLEREGLFLKQYAVLFQLLAGEPLRTLRVDQVPPELPVQFRTLEGRGGRDRGHLVVGRVGVALQGRLQRGALGDQ